VVRIGNGFRARVAYGLRSRYGPSLLASASRPERHRLDPILARGPAQPGQLEAFRQARLRLPVIVADTIELTLEQPPLLRRRLRRPDDDQDFCHAGKGFRGRHLHPLARTLPPDRSCPTAPARRYLSDCPGLGPP